jgi:hypothetical protein
MIVVASRVGCGCPQYKLRNFPLAELLCFNYQNTVNTHVTPDHDFGRRLFDKGHVFIT